MKSFFHRRAFTLLEILVILGIIVLFLALLVPFAFRFKEGGRSTVCLQNFRQIGKSILAYAKDNDGRLPGPLSVDQYPVVSAGNPPRDGQLLKYLLRYLDTPAGLSGGAQSAKAVFMCPSWQRSEHTTDAPLYLINNEIVEPLDQPAWGNETKPPLKLDDLKVWKMQVGDKPRPVDISKAWAMTEADQEVARLTGYEKEKWMERLPADAVHFSQRNALFFDMHVAPLRLSKTAEVQDSLAR